MFVKCKRTHYSNKHMTLYEQGVSYDVDVADPRAARFFEIPEEPAERKKPGPKPREDKE